MKLNPHVAGLPGAVYSRFAQRLAAFSGTTAPLHIGDTWLEPPCRMEDLHDAGIHRYTNVHGLPPLLSALAERVTRDSGHLTSTDEIQITAGATGGLTAAVAAMIEPGDEVVILAPAWPLVGGAVRALGGVVRHVPSLGHVQTAAELVAAVQAQLTSKTVALYWNTPNNPTGLHIPESWLRALVELARAHDLWILADEVYSAYVYNGQHTWSRPLAPERTIAAYSFSKAYGMAGNRVGYLVGPADFLAHVRKVSTYTVYSAPTASQWAALAALEPSGDRWVAHARKAYAELGSYAADKLGVPTPDGSTFVFVDIAEALDERGLNGFLERAVERGVLVAPGPTFGPYPTHIRVCFTSCEPERVRYGIDTLAALIRSPSG